MGFREVWHAHEEAQLVYVTRGVLRIFTHHGMWTLPPYNAIWLPPRYARTACHRRSGGAQRLYFAEADPFVDAHPFCQVLLVNELLNALIGRMAAANAEPGGIALVTPLLLFELSLAGKVLTGTLALPDDRWLRAICERLLESPENNDKLDRWSERVGASPRTLARLFRRETGLGFAQWRQQLRLVEAVARLALDVPVSVIASELGYGSSSAFIAMFRKTLGDTPQRYLQRHAG